MAERGIRNAPRCACGAGRLCKADTPHQHLLTGSDELCETRFNHAIVAKMFDALYANAYISALYDKACGFNV